MAGSPTASASAAEATDGPVLSVVSKRLRALRKKYNRILQLEESFAAGKTLNRQQEEVLQDGEPNDRRIGKLCDYVSRNPTRIPKITEYLEQRCYKELRHENFTLAKVVPCIYRKLLCSCKEHIPLLATSTLSLVRTLLDQKSNDDLRVLGCLMLVDFLNSQVDSTHMFNLEGLIPKLCQIGQELREDDKGLRLRSAALQALAYMVQYMGDHSHISMELDEPWQLLKKAQSHSSIRLWL